MVMKKKEKHVLPRPDGRSAVKKIVAVVIVFFGSIFLMAETYALLTTIIPYVSIAMFQSTGISVADGLTFGEFSVGDIIVLCMMWLFPCLCGIGLATAAQWKLIKFCVGKMARVVRNAFFSGRASGESSKASA